MARFLFLKVQLKKKKKKVIRDVWWWNKRAGGHEWTWGPRSNGQVKNAMYIFLVSLLNIANLRPPPQEPPSPHLSTTHGGSRDPRRWRTPRWRTRREEATINRWAPEICRVRRSTAERGSRVVVIAMVIAVLMLITEKHTAELQRQHEGDSRLPHHQESANPRLSRKIYKIYGAFRKLSFLNLEYQYFSSVHNQIITETLSHQWS